MTRELAFDQQEAIDSSRPGAHQHAGENCNWWAASFPSSRNAAAGTTIRARVPFMAEELRASAGGEDWKSD